MKPIDEGTPEVCRGTAARIKGMLKRGDQVQDIAVWFGLSLRVVKAVQCGAVHPFVAPAPRHALPEAGPYVWASDLYSALAEVNDAERRLFELRHAVERPMPN